MSANVRLNDRKLKATTADQPWGQSRLRLDPAVQKVRAPSPGRAGPANGMPSAALTYRFRLLRAKPPPAVERATRSGRRGRLPHLHGLGLAGKTPSPDALRASTLGSVPEGRLFPAR